MSEPLLPLADALASLLGLVGPLPTETVRVQDAAGRVLARDAHAAVSLPRFDNSAMDGFAVRAADTGGASSSSPAHLRLLSAVHAGHRPDSAVDSGTAMPIATGAPLPAGADAVVRIEEVRTEGGTLVVPVEVSPGRDVRQAGEDVEAGDLLVAAGRRLGAWQVGALHGAGVTEVSVYRRPRVVVVLTGDEVVVEGPLTDSSIPDAIGPALLARLAGDGADAEIAGPVPDDLDVHAAVLKDAAASADLVVTVGGVSVGPRDHIRAVMDATGAVVGARVALRPGKPVAWGHVGGTPLLALPGNPQAAAVTWELLGRPTLDRLAGGPGRGALTLHATLAAPITQRPGRLHAVPVRLHVDRSLDDRALGGGRLVAEPLGPTGASRLRPLAGSDGWILLPEDVEEVPAGATVTVLVVRAP